MCRRASHRLSNLRAQEPPAPKTWFKGHVLGPPPGCQPHWVTSGSPETLGKS